MGVCFTLVECCGYFKREKDGGWRTDGGDSGLLRAVSVCVVVFFEC